MLPFVFVGKPCGKRCTQLSQYHKKQINGRLRSTPLNIQFIPSFAGEGLVAGSNLFGCFHMAGVFDESKQIDHHQHHTQKSHEQTTQCQQEYTVCLGTDVTEDIHQ